MYINFTMVGGGGFGDPIKTFAAIASAITDECAEGVRFMTQYPPEPNGSRYVRTGKLRQSWSSEVKSGGNRIEGKIGSSSNVAPYNRDVQGENQEALFKRIGWHSIEDFRSKVEKGFPGRIQSMIDKAFG